MIPIAKYNAEGRCIKAGLSLRPLKRKLGRAKRRLTPSVKMQERIEWAVTGVVMVLGTVVAVEVMAAFAAILM